MDNTNYYRVVCAVSNVNVKCSINVYFEKALNLLRTWYTNELQACIYQKIVFSVRTQQNFTWKIHSLLLSLES